MTEYFAYLTREGDRWDLISFRFYGDVRQQDRLIAANPECAITPLLPPGLRLRVPLIDPPREAPRPLPPWKRG